jgi:hypothetical protein
MAPRARGRVEIAGARIATTEIATTKIATTETATTETATTETATNVAPGLARALRRDAGGPRRREVARPAVPRPRSARDLSPRR